MKVFDPEAMENVKAKFGDRVTFCSEQYEAVIGVDALAIVTEWSVFRTPSYKVMKELMKSPVIFDGRNLYDNKTLEGHGFYYNSIGRNVVNSKKKPTAVLNGKK